MATPEMEQLLSPFMKQLGLKWRVMVGFADVIGPQIVSRRGELAHQLTFPESYRQHPTAYRYEIAHQLSIGKLAETHDPIFATARIHPDWYIDESDLEIKQTMLFYTWQPVVDVWADDQVSKMDPQLMVDSFNTWLYTLDLVFKGRYADIGNLLVLTHGQTVAQLNRFERQVNKKADKAKLWVETQRKQLDVASRQIERLFGEKTVDLIDGVNIYLTNLPYLPTERDAGLALLEDATQGMCRILSFPLEPMLGIYQDEVVWLTIPYKQ